MIFIMSNEKMIYHINDADRLLKSGEYLLDVREQFEYEAGHIAGAGNISVNELEERLGELPEDKKIHAYCQKGKRGADAVDILRRNGFEAVNLEEGFSAYTGEYDSSKSVPDTQVPPAHENIELDPERVRIEASGLQCPGPLLRVNETMGQLDPGQQMEITVTDFGFCTDVEAWAKKTGNTVLKNEKKEDKVVVVLEKNDKQPETSREGHQMMETKNGATMVVFSGDLDKALASFIIATGAKSMGKDVTMFFTFWGLNVIKDPNAPKKNKKGLDKAFSMMMPKSAAKLPISKMNMFGLGSKMIQYVMQKKKVDALTEMIDKADSLGVKMVACTMSMDIMAIEADELLPNVNFGGVGTYLGDAENGNLNLFI